MKAPVLAALCIPLALAAATATAGPADDLLPPPVRTAEKRSLLANPNGQRTYYNGPGGLGAAFSPDGKHLLTAAGFQGMTLWDVGDGRALGSLPLQTNGGGMAAAFTHGGEQLVVACCVNPGMGLCPVSVWDVARRERLRSLDDDVNDTPFTAAAAAPDGKTVALAGGLSRRNEPPAVCLWDLATGDEVGRIEGLVAVDPMRRNLGAFAALAYSPDGRTLAVLLDGRVVLVEVATGKSRGQLPFAAPSDNRTNPQGIALGALAFSPDGRTLAAGCPDGAVRRFDLRAGRELTPLSGHSGPVLAVCFPPGGKSILSYGLDGQFYAWRADADREWRPKPGPLDDASLDALWDAMRGDDPGDLYGCAEDLAAAPDQAVRFLRKRLAPAPKEDAGRIDRLVQEVHKGDYNARKKAVTELRKIGAAALPALQRSLQMGGYDELTNRLVFEFNNLSPPPEQLRAERAVAVLERIGGAEAGKLLDELADGAPDAPLTVKAKAAAGRRSAAGPAKPAATPDSLWQALTADDGATAYEAVRTLAGRPGAPALLRDRLKDVIAADAFDDDPKRVAGRIADLNSDDFTVREKASKDLRNLGKLIVPALSKALEANPSSEARRRLAELLEAARKTAPPPEMLRVGRALEALEMAGGPEGRQALEALGKDARTPWLREATAEALRRIGEAKQ